MSQTLGFIQTDRYTEEDNKRKSYNSQISENYQRMMTMNSSDWANQLLEERFQSSPEAQKRLQPRRPITFENVVIPENVRRETQQYPVMHQAPVAQQYPTMRQAPVVQQYPAMRQAPVAQQYPAMQQTPVVQQYPTMQQAPVAQPNMQTAQTAYVPKTNYSDSIYTSSANRQAAWQNERAAATVAEVRDETLSMPTSTTLQYGRQAQAAMQTAASVAPAYAPGYTTYSPAQPAAPAYAPTAAPKVETGTRTVASAAEDMRAYYASLAKKVLVAFAVAFVVMMVVIAVNSAILGSINLELTALQEELSVLQAEVSELQQSIAQETSWESILAFIQQNGMIQSA